MQVAFPPSYSVVCLVQVEVLDKMYFDSTWREWVHFRERCGGWRRLEEVRTIGRKGGGQVAHITAAIDGTEALSKFC